MGSKAPLGCRPTSRHLSLTPAYRELRTGAVEPSSSPVWPRGTRALASSEEPRPLMFYFRWLGCPHCGPILDAGAWRHTSTPDRSRRPPRRIWMRKITATGGGQVAQDEGTLLIGINLALPQVVTMVWRTELGTTLLNGLKGTTGLSAYFAPPVAYTSLPRIANWRGRAKSVS